MKKKLLFQTAKALILMMLCFFAPHMNAQTWQKLHLSCSDNLFYSSSVQTSDGYVVTGGVTTNNSQWVDEKGLIIKFNMNGDTVWSKRHTLNNHAILPRKIIKTSDGGYAIVGDNFSGGFGNGVFMMKLDANGNKQWGKEFTQSDSIIHNSSTIIQANDGGYVIAGSLTSPQNGQTGVLNSYFTWIKTDANGNLAWEKTLDPDTSSSYLSQAVQTGDGGYFFTGTTGEYPLLSVYSIKTNASGDTLWTDVENCSTSPSVQITPATGGGFIISKYTGSQYVIKTDANMNPLSTNLITFNTNGYYGFGPVYETSDGGYITTSAVFSSVLDVKLIKMDSNFNSEWSQMFNTSYYAASVAYEAVDGGYMLVGYINMNLSVNPACNNIRLIKTDSLGNAPALGITDNIAFQNNILIYPNPAKDDITISFSNPDHESYSLIVNDINGRVMQKIENIRENSAELNVSEFSSGVYFVTIVSEKNLFARQKIVIE